MSFLNDSTLTTCLRVVSVFKITFLNCLTFHSPLASVCDAQSLRLCSTSRKSFLAESLPRLTSPVCCQHGGSCWGLQHYSAGILHYFFLIFCRIIQCESLPLYFDIFGRLVYYLTIWLVLCGARTVILKLKLNWKRNIVTNAYWKKL